MGRQATLQGEISLIFLRKVQTKQGMYKYILIEFLFDLTIPSVKPAAFYSMFYPITSTS